MIVFQRSDNFVDDTKPLFGCTDVRVTLLFFNSFQRQRPELVEIADRTKSDGDVGVQSDSSSSCSSSSSSSCSSDSESSDSEQRGENIRNNNHIKKRWAFVMRRKSAVISLCLIVLQVVLLKRYRRCLITRTRTGGSYIYEMLLEVPFH